MGTINQKEQIAQKRCWFVSYHFSERNALQPSMTRQGIGQALIEIHPLLWFIELKKADPTRSIAVTFWEEVRDPDVIRQSMLYFEAQNGPKLTM